MTPSRIDASGKAVPLKPQVNNFSLTIATVNGTGSQTANSILLRSLFCMGIPVSGKNIFPSNIKGLPSWFLIRLNEKGFTARCAQPEILVAMNSVTMEEDIAGLASGGICLHPDDRRISMPRQDIMYYPFPATRLAQESGAESKLRPYLANMVYIGVLGWMLKIPEEEISSAVSYYFRGKEHIIEMNSSIITAARNWAEANLIRTGAFQVERIPHPAGRMLMDGNTAAALGIIWGGMSFAAWYPITPASTLAEALQDHLPHLRKDPATGKNTFVVVQAEDEIAAIGMAVGAGWAGARSLTSTSGPGLSLMTEYVGLAYFAEVPVVIWDVQRLGPSTGLPTRTSQGDLMAAYTLGHGDGRHVVLLPAAEDLFSFGWLAFDLAERLQTPVLVLSDMDLGMNFWSLPAFEYPDTPMDRGKVLTREDLDRGTPFARYQDVDGDGICWRTLPGTNHPRAGYFTRGTGHNEQARYSERPDDWSANMARLNRKFETARCLVPKPVLQEMPHSRIGILAYGSTDPAVQEARSILREDGIPNDYLRLRALPFAPQVKDFLERHDRIYVVEANSDGQLFRLLCMEYPGAATGCISLRIGDGLPLTADRIIESVLVREKDKT